MSPDELLAGLSVIAGLVVLEGLLSVDNVLGIAALARELPESKQRIAIRIGLALAYIFRVLALFVAGWLASNTWVRWLGAGYLIWLMSSHLTKSLADDAAETMDDGETADAPVPENSNAVARNFRLVLIQIGLMDLSLSIDNVIAAVGLAPKDASGDPVMWPIYAGVLIAILALQAIAPYAVSLLKKYPILEPTAFVLIGYVGGLLIFEESWRLFTGHAVHMPAYVKFAGIVLLIIVALRYAASNTVRTLVQPVIWVAVPVMRGITRVVAFLMTPFEYLLEMIAGGGVPV